MFPPKATTRTSCQRTQIKHVKGYTRMLIWMRFPAVTSLLLTIACICVICIYLSYKFCLSFYLTVHYHVVISDKEEIKSIYIYMSMSMINALAYRSSAPQCKTLGMLFWGIHRSRLMRFYICPYSYFKQERTASGGRCLNFDQMRAVEALVRQCGHAGSCHLLISIKISCTGPYN